MSARRGATAAEFAIALLIAGVAAALGGRMLVAAERRVRGDMDSDRSAQAARDAAQLVTTDVASARWGSLAIRGDTALDLDAHVGISVVCAATPGVVVLPASRVTTGTPWSFWRQAPEVNDLAAIWDSAGTGSWALATIDSVSSPTDGAGCPADGVFRTVADSVGKLAVTRMHVMTPFRATRGAPVRVFRRVRWTLYRAADRSWWLGYRRCPLGACAAVQPAAGPFASPADTGVRFQADSTGGVSVTLRPALTASIAAPVRLFTAVRGAPRLTP